MAKAITIKVWEACDGRLFWDEESVLYYEQSVLIQECKDKLKVLLMDACDADPDMMLEGRCLSFDDLVNMIISRKEDVHFLLSKVVQHD